MQDLFSFDTDVFALLTGHFQLIPPSTTVIRKGGDRISIKEIITKLAPKSLSALIGWYIFKCSDNTGSFAGKGMACRLKHCFKLMMISWLHSASMILQLKHPSGLTVTWRGTFAYCTRSGVSLHAMSQSYVYYSFRRRTKKLQILLRHTAWH